MARETKEERAERLRREQDDLAAAEAEFKQSIPKRMLELQCAAQIEGVSVNVKLTETGPMVSFYDDNSGIDTDLTYQSVEWEFDSLEREIGELKSCREAAERRLAQARDVWSKLTTDDQKVLKEFINRLF